MVSVFDFIDFREYLREYYRDKKNVNPHFSYQMLAEKAGIRNRGFVYNIIKGTHKVSKAHCVKLSKALNHVKKEARYFEAIVGFTQAKNEEERTASLELMQQLVSIEKIPAVLIGKEHYEFLSHWYHSAIRSLIDMYPVGENIETVCAMIYPPITVTEAKKSVELLERLGLIAMGDDNLYHVTEKNLAADKKLAAIARNRYYLECTELAKQAVLRPSSKKNIVSALTLGISRSSYERIYDETMRFKDQLIEIANSDERADRVYHYQLHFFPLTAAADEKGGIA